MSIVVTAAELMAVGLWERFRCQMSTIGFLENDTDWDLDRDFVLDEEDAQALGFLVI